MSSSAPNPVPLSAVPGAGKPLDARGVANLILDQAGRDEIELTNLALQKLLYFAHALFLMRHKLPLVSGYFEAWKYGPVHPIVYRSFKEAGGQPIKCRATRQDPLSGKISEINIQDDLEIRQHIREVMRSYGRLTPGQLVDISHARGAPWHVVVEKGQGSSGFGLRITDGVILQRFMYHKVTVGDRPSSGDPREDTPPA